ncbi:MAG TPA: hypothetical protein VGV93_12365 [Acidimicrobiales bacterium]|nr:hypothetical protein [Acidimicrobiales bacterium]
MALQPLPGRRPLARAATSPLAVAAGGTGVGLGALAGEPFLAAAAGVLAYAAGLALAHIRRRPRSERIDPFTVGERWRPFVRGALQASARYRRTVEGVDPGPLRDRLEEIGAMVDSGVRECWRVARRGHELDDAVSALDAPGTRARLARIEEGTGGDADQSVARSLRARLSTAERLAGVAGEARERLRVLQARLDEAVARATELALAQGGTGLDAGALGGDIEHLVDDLEALRAGLDEAEAAGQ